MVLESGDERSLNKCDKGTMTVMIGPYYLIKSQGARDGVLEAR